MRPIPVLMYHRVGIPLFASQDRFLNVSVKSLLKQLNLLVKLGYQSRTFHEVVTSTNLPEKTVVITFDDAFECVFEHALPILEKVGYVATTYAVTDFVGRMNSWEEGKNSSHHPLMSWERLADLQSKGWEIGGHTCSHPHLDVLDFEQTEAQLQHSAQELDARLGAIGRSFCYPFGHYRAETVDLVSQAGFSGACTTKSGLFHRGTDIYQVPRVKISYSDGALGLVYKLMVRPHMPDLRKARRDLASK